MADFKPKPGSFLPFLESAERGKPAPSAPAGSPLTLLDTLLRKGPSLPMFDLQSLSGMDPSRYAEALKSLTAAGFIEISGDAPEQSVVLTPAGRNVVGLAKPT